MRHEEFAHRPTARLVAAAVLLAAVAMLAGCITQIMPAWNVTAIMWRATGDPIADVNDNWHYPAEGHVWQFVWLRMENMTGRPRASESVKQFQVNIMSLMRRSPHRRSSSPIESNCGNRRLNPSQCAAY